MSLYSCVWIDVPSPKNILKHSVSFQQPTFDILKFKHDSEALGAKLPIFHDSIVSPFPEVTQGKQNGPNGPFASNSLLRPKPFSKVAIIKTKSVTIAFFSSPPFLHLALSLSPFLFLRYYDFEASRV